MENVTVFSVNVACGLAGLLFFGVFFVKRATTNLGEISPPPVPVGKVPVWAYNDADLLGLIGITGFYYLMGIGNASMSGGDSIPKISAFGLWLNIGLQLFLVGMVTLIVWRRIRPVQWLGLAWKKWPWVFLIAPAVWLAMVMIFNGLYAVGYMELMEYLGVEKVQDTVAIFQKEKDMSIVVLLAFAAVIIAPICEEIVFRGYLYPVAKKFTGPWIAGVCSALVFSAVHGSMSALLPLFLLGLVLVALYEYTGSIWAPIAVHFLFNGATVAVQMLVRYGIITGLPS